MNNELVIARKSQKMTQKQVAQRVNIDRTVYNRIERGMRKPDVDVAVRIAAVVQKKVEEIFLQ